MPYEINSQEPRRHLTLTELREMGSGMVRASAAYLESSQGRTLVDANTVFQAQRLERWKKFGKGLAYENALAAEEKVRQRAIAEQKGKAQSNSDKKP
jgi:hypothetical protein